MGPNRPTLPDMGAGGPPISPATEGAEAPSVSSATYHPEVYGEVEFVWQRDPMQAEHFRPVPISPQRQQLPYECTTWPVPQYEFCQQVPYNYALPSNTGLQPAYPVYGMPIQLPHRMYSPESTLTNPSYASSPMTAPDNRLSPVEHSPFHQHHETLPMRYLTPPSSSSCSAYSPSIPTPDNRLSPVQHSYFNHVQPALPVRYTTPPSSSSCSNYSPATTGEVEKPSKSKNRARTARSPSSRSSAATRHRKAPRSKKTPAQLGRQIVDDQGNEKVECDWPGCHKLFGRGADAARHSRSKHQGDEHRCRRCHSVYNRSDILRRHLSSCKKQRARL